MIVGPIDVVRVPSGISLLSGVVDVVVPTFPSWLNSQSKICGLAG